MFLGVYIGHPCCQGWLCCPCLQSGTLNILQVPPFLTPPSWHTSNKDINTKFSGYLSWARIWSPMTSRMTMSSMSLIRTPQCPPTPPHFLDHPFWHTSNKDIITKFSVYQMWQGYQWPFFKKLLLNYPHCIKLVLSKLLLKTYLDWHTQLICCHIGPKAHLNSPSHERVVPWYSIYHHPLQHSIS